MYGNFFFDLPEIRFTASRIEVPSEQSETDIDADADSDSWINSITVDWRITGDRMGSSRSCAYDYSEFGFSLNSDIFLQVSSATDYSRIMFDSRILLSTFSILFYTFETLCSILIRTSFLVRLILASNYYVISNYFLCILSSNSSIRASVAYLSISDACILSSYDMILFSSGSYSVSPFDFLSLFLEYNARSSLFAPIRWRILFCIFITFLSLVLFSESVEHKSDEAIETWSWLFESLYYCAILACVFSLFFNTKVYSFSSESDIFGTYVRLFRFLWTLSTPPYVFKRRFKLLLPSNRSDFTTEMSIGYFSLSMLFFTI